MTKNCFPETKDLIRRLLPGEENKEIRNLMYIFIHTDLTNAKEFEKVDKETRTRIQLKWELEKFKEWENLNHVNFLVEEIQIIQDEKVGDWFIHPPAMLSANIYGPFDTKEDAESFSKDLTRVGGWK